MLSTVNVIKINIVIYKPFIKWKIYRLVKRLQYFIAISLDVFIDVYWQWKTRLFELNRQANYLRIRSQTSSNLRPSDYALQSSITETLKWARPVLGCKVWYFETSSLYYVAYIFSDEINIQTCRAESSCFKNCRSQRQVPKQNYNSHTSVNERSLWTNL